MYFFYYFPIGLDVTIRRRATITWFLAIGLSFPISDILLTIISESMMGTSMDVTFTTQGIVIWLAVVIALSFTASILPARNAARLTIQEVLAYE